MKIKLYFKNEEHAAMWDSFKNLTPDIDDIHHDGRLRRICFNIPISISGTTTKDVYREVEFYFQREEGMLRWVRWISTSVYDKTCSSQRYLAVNGPYVGETMSKVFAKPGYFLYNKSRDNNEGPTAVMVYIGEDE
jgi:hypothetical protein